MVLPEDSGEVNCPLHLGARGERLNAPLYFASKERSVWQNGRGDGRTAFVFWFFRRHGSGATPGQAVKVRSEDYAHAPAPGAGGITGAEWP